MKVYVLYKDEAKTELSCVSDDIQKIQEHIKTQYSGSYEKLALEIWEDRTCVGIKFGNDIGTVIDKAVKYTNGLLPCPYCGEPAVIRTINNKSDLKIWCQCSRCYAKTEAFCATTTDEFESFLLIEACKNKARGCWKRRFTG